MKIIDIINEAPLPDDWDHEIYNPQIPFKTRVAYAKQRAKQVGRGSSRVAFELPYEGRRTVLKVALNRKGIAQNEAELETLQNWYLEKLNMMIPLIDADEENYTWIHTEFAEKAKDSDFVKEVGVPLRQFIEYFHQFKRSLRGGRTKSPEEFDPKLNTDSELFQSMEEYVGNYSDVMINDYERLANWGIYDGRLVIIDAGFNADTEKLYRR